MRFASFALIIGLVVEVTFAQIPEVFETVDIIRHDEHKRDGDINNCGVVVFQQAQRAEFERIEVFSYDNGFIRQISFSDGRSSQLPAINDLGTIVWTGNRVVLRDSRLMLWKEGVAEDLGRGWGPDIDNLDHVSWNEIYGFDECFETYMRFYDGETIRTIGTGEFSDQGPSLNDFDEIAWTEYRFCNNPWESEIVLYEDDQRGHVTTD